MAKLIPAEALGLYGAGMSLVAGDRNNLSKWILAAACLAFAGALRWVATKGSRGTTQWLAVGIAIVSFALWLAALPAGSSPISLGEHAKIAGLLALICATVVPVFYKGD